MNSRMKVMERVKSSVFFLYHSGALWVLLICFVFRSIYYGIYPSGAWWYSDTASYYYAAQQILHGKIDAFRTPVYPLILKLIDVISRDNVFEYTVIFQRVISFISIVPFFLFCRISFKNKYIAIPAAIVYGCIPYILLYNNGICPESILISSLSFLLYLLAAFVARPSNTKAIALSGMLVFLVLLKPVCLFLYGVFIGIWLLQVIREKRKKVFVFALLSMLAGSLLILGYCFINKKQNGVFGISTVSHDNNFANIILSDAYRSLDDSAFVSAVDSLMDKGIYFTIYYLNNDHNKYRKIYSEFPRQYDFTEDMVDVVNIPYSRYNYSKDQLDLYIKKAMSSEVFLGYIIEKVFQFAHSDLLYLNGYVVYLLLLVHMAIIIWFIIYRKKLLLAELFIFLFLSGWLFTFFVAGLADSTQHRVMLPAAPFFVALIFDLLDKAFLKITNRKPPNT